MTCQEERCSIHGMPGFPGFPGTPGVKGDAGPKGDKGDQGSTSTGGPHGPPPSVGVTYTRWGSTSCNSTLIYSGRVGGPRYTEGGGANFLCLPDDPEYELPHIPGVQGYSYIYGTEYGLGIGGKDNQNVPCAVCYTPSKTATLMIPAKDNCPSGWNREYYGYLMSAYRLRDKRIPYTCVDKSLSVIPGLGADNNDALMYHVEASCNGLDCGRYIAEKELNCVVCTK